MAAGLTITAIDIFHVGMRTLSGTTSCADATSPYTITCDGSNGYFSGLEVGQGLSRGTKKYRITTVTSTNSIDAVEEPTYIWARIERVTDSTGTYLSSTSLEGLPDGTRIYILGTFASPLAVYTLTGSPTEGRVYSTGTVHYDLTSGTDITIGTKYKWCYIEAPHATWSAQTLKCDYEPYSLSLTNYRIYACNIAQKVNAVDHTTSITGILAGSGFTDTNGASVLLSANDEIRIWVSYTNTSGYTQEQVYFKGIVKEVKTESKRVTIICRPLNSILSEQTFSDVEQTTHYKRFDDIATDNILSASSVPLYGASAHQFTLSGLGGAITPGYYPKITFSGQTLWDALKLISLGANLSFSTSSPSNQVVLYAGPNSVANEDKLTVSKINGQDNDAVIYAEVFGSYNTTNTVLNKAHFLKPVTWSDTSEDLIVNACRFVYRTLNYSYEDKTSQDRNGYRALSLTASNIDYLDGGTPDMATSTYMMQLPKNIVTAYTDPYYRCTIVTAWNYICTADNSGSNGVVPVLNRRFEIVDSHEGGSGKDITEMVCIGYALDVMTGLVVLDLSTRIPYNNVISELDARISTIEGDLDAETGTVVRINEDAYIFNGPLIPAETDSYDVGSPELRWGTLNCNSINTGLLATRGPIILNNNVSATEDNQSTSNATIVLSNYIYEIEDNQLIEYGGTYIGPTSEYASRVAQHKPLNGYPKYFAVRLFHVGGTADGDFYFEIRRVSDDEIILSKFLVAGANVSSEDYVWCGCTLTLEESLLIDETVRVGVSLVGASTGLYYIGFALDEKDGEYMEQYQYSTWLDYSYGATDLIYKYTYTPSLNSIYRVAQCKTINGFPTLVGFKLNYSGSPCDGVVYARIRNASTDAVLLEKVLTNGNTLTETPTWYHVDFASTESVLISNTSCYISCEYSGTGQVYVAYNNASVKGSENMYQYDTYPSSTWTSDSAFDLAYLFEYLSITTLVDEDAVANFGPYCSLNGVSATTYEGYYGVKSSGWASGSRNHRMGVRDIGGQKYFTFDTLNDAEDAIDHSPLRIVENGTENIGSPYGSKCLGSTNRRYYSAPHCTAAALVNKSLNAGTLYSCHFIATETATLDSILMNCVTTNSTHHHIGVYDTVNGNPGNLLYDTGDVATSSGLNTAAPNIQISAGQMYWIVLLVSVNSVWSGADTSYMLNNLGYTSGFANILQSYSAQTYGALSSTWPSINYSSNPPIIALYGLTAIS